MVLHVGKEPGQKIWSSGLLFRSAVNNNIHGICSEVKSSPREIYVSLVFLDAALGLCTWTLNSCLFQPPRRPHQRAHIFAVHWSLTPLTSDSFIRDLLGFKNLVLANSFSFLSKTSVTKLFLTSIKIKHYRMVTKTSTSGFFVLCIYNVLRSADIKFLHNRKINM